MSDRTALRIAQFREAVARLAEALAQEENEFMRDSIIKRFEICFELAWHALQDRLKEEGLEGNTPLRALQGALQAEWIDDADAWSTLLDFRNLTVHTYKKEVAIRVAAFVRESGHALFSDLARRLTA
ncbi:MAG: HI0074 family nucleotidyltransferase substrate-binding subunit [Betaproteobacteria bacterium]